MNEPDKFLRMNPLSRCVVFLKVDTIARTTGAQSELFKLLLEFCEDRKRGEIQTEINRLYKAQIEADQERKDREYIKELYDCINSGTRSAEYERRHGKN